MGNIILMFPALVGTITLIIQIQSDLTYPHTSVLDEITDKVRELDK